MEIAKPFLDVVANRIRGCKDLKPILFLITEDRDVIHELLARRDCFILIREGKRVNYRKGGEYDNLNLGEIPKLPTEEAPPARKEAYDGGIFPRLPYAPKSDVVFVKGPQYQIYLDWQLKPDSKALIEYIKRLEELGTEKAKGKNMIIVSTAPPGNSIPAGYEQFVQVIDIPMIGMYEIAELVAEMQETVHGAKKLDVDAYAQKPDPYTEFLKGMTRSQVRFVLNKLINQFEYCTGRGLPQAIDNDKLNQVAREIIFEVKEQMAAMDGIISFIDTDKTVKPGGMDGLEQWLERLKKVLKEPEEARNFGVEFPRGILLAGLPGSGKSLTAKYVAKILELPLIQFKMSDILNDHVGGSEAKLKKVLKLIEACAPCVVWIDEIEKELPNKKSSEGDSGVGKRCLATLLHWMQENDKQCFICATANHVGSLPSELLRRGRFERKYYTFLPMQAQCEEILSAHLEHARKDSPTLFADSLFAEGKLKPGICRQVFAEIAKMPRKFFTGADLEGLVKDLKLVLFHRNIQLSTVGELVKWLVYLAKKSKPYGETNFQEVVEYWCDMQRNPFQNTGVSEPEGPDEEPAQNPIYSYIPFDFTDLQFDGEKWHWRADLEAHGTEYDRQMFLQLRDPIVKRMDERTRSGFGGGT